MLMDIFVKIIDYTDNKKILANLSVSYNQLTSTIRYLSDNKIDQTLKISTLESMFLNFRLVFEFFDKAKNHNDFDILNLIPDWKYEYIAEMAEFKKFINHNVMHFSSMRLIFDEEVTVTELWFTISKMSVISDKLKTVFIQCLLAKDKELYNFFKFSLE